jgi:acylphosphatase
MAAKPQERHAGFLISWECASPIYCAILRRAFGSECVSSLDQGVRMKVARIFLISGDVQGVGYRFFAQRAAARHQVLGYVRNLADGRVEALAEGTPESVEAFKHDLATGPAFADVGNIEEINVEPTGNYTFFRIER